MLRRLAVIAVALVLGALVTTLTAFACAAFAEVAPGRNDRPTEADVAWWARRAPADLARRPEKHARRAAAFGVEHRELWAKAAAPSPRGPVRVMRHQRIRTGWPLRSLEGAWWADPGVPGGRRADALYEVPITAPFVGARTVPLRPLWPGFLLDTLLVAAAFLALRASARSVRSLVRRRRALCPRCGYPRGRSPVCTECGGRV